MRLDKYLKVSRIIKRRTVANEPATPAESSSTARLPALPTMWKVNDVIELTLGARTVKARVVSVNEYAKKRRSGYDVRDHTKKVSFFDCAF